MMKAKSLPLVVQLMLLRKHIPEGRGQIGASRKGRQLRWFQAIRPHVLGAVYQIELQYAEGHRPLVLVISPDLQALAGKRKLPHTFREVNGKPSLCLWFRGDWDFSQPVATTVIPWAAEWFWFFEHWLVTGEWLGGGRHDTPITPPEQSVAI
ncbi:MAG: hypothetical protein JSS11_05830 [Verrucomicrobia bacterium]|nr:hypothetical protein [Verrucomicrobiota bacterium]